MCWWHISANAYTTVNESFWKPLTVKHFGRFVEYKARLEASEWHYYFDLLK